MKIAKPVWILTGLCVVFAIFAIAMILWGTQNGIGLSPDSLTYLNAAKNVLAGKGLTANHELLTHFPPGYPLLIALISLPGFDQAFLLRLMHALLYAANGLLFGLIIYHLTKHNLLATAAAFLIFYSSRFVLKMHSFAWSESPFVLFSLGSFYIFARHISEPKWRLIVSGSILIGLAILTRLAGLALLFTVLISIMFLENQPVRKRIKEAIVVALLGILPITLWALHNFFIQSQFLDRGFTVHLSNLSVVNSLFTALINVAMPISLRFFLSAVLSLLILTAIIIGLIFLSKRQFLNKPLSSAMSFLLLSFLFVVIYILEIFLVNSFLDVTTTFDERILTPSYLFTILGSVLMAWFILQNSRLALLKWLSLILVILLVAVNVPSTVSAELNFADQGISINSISWKHSKELLYIKNIPDNVKLYSNLAGYIQYTFGRDSYLLPEIGNYMTEKSNPEYLDQINAVCKESQSGKAMIIYYLDYEDKWYLPSKEEIQARCNLQVLFSNRSAIIYGEVAK